MIYTIGFAKKPLEYFIRILKENNITKVIDIRLRRSSQLSGFAKEKDLRYILAQFSIKYQAIPELAPDENLLEKFHKDKDWETYEKRFRQLMARRNIEKFKDEILNPNENVCLLCAEQSPEKCHRRLIAEFFSRLGKGIEIKHL